MRVLFIRVSHEGPGRLTGNVESRPECGETDRQLAGGVEVRGHEDGTGNETTLKQANEGAGDVKAGPVGHESLKGRYMCPNISARGPPDCEPFPGPAGDHLQTIPHPHINYRYHVSMVKLRLERRILCIRWGERI